MSLSSSSLSGVKLFDLLQSGCSLHYEDTEMDMALKLHSVLHSRMRCLAISDSAEMRLQGVLWGRLQAQLMVSFTQRPGVLYRGHQ